MSTRTIELRIEDAWITALTAVAGAYPVRHWRDADAAEAYPCFVVHCGPVGRQQDDRGHLYECPVAIGAQAYWADDKGRDALDLMAAAIQQLVNTVAASSLTAAPITFAGIVWGDAAETTDDKVTTRSIQALCYIQLTGSLTSTTTTSTTTSTTTAGA